MGDDPLILLVLKGILHFIGCICAIFALPTTLFYGLVKVFCNLKQKIDDNATMHFFLWLPRFIVCSLLIPIFLLEGAGFGYLLYFITKKVIVAVFCAIGALIVAIIGLIYTQKSRLKKIAPKFKAFGDEGFFPSLGDSILDFCAFFCLLFSVAGVLRIPALLIITFSSKDLDHSRRTYIFQQVLFTILDWICLPFLLITFVFMFWRLPKLFQHWEKDSEHWDAVEFTHSVGVRGSLMYQFINGLLDIPVFTIGFVFILFFSPWRLIILFTKLAKKKTIGQRRGVIMKQFLKALADLFFIILSIPVIITLYRLPSLLICIFKGKEASERRLAAAIHFGCVWLDLLTLICFPLLLISIYRLPRMYLKIQGKTWAFTSDDDGVPKSPKAQGKIIWQVLMFIRDIPFILGGLLLTLLIWRAFFLWRDVYKATNANERRRAVAHHLLWSLVDIIEIPFALMAFLMIITLWRIYPLYKKFTGAVGRNEKRKSVIKQFLWWLLDIPTFFAALIVLVTIYRAGNMIRGLKAFFSPAQPANNLPGADQEENPAPEERPYSWHSVVWKQMALLLLDLPIALLVPFTLWRMPFLIRRMLKEDSPMQRRLMVLKELWALIKDIPCIIFVLIMWITVWRIPSFIDLVKKHEQGDNEHVALLKLFGKWCCDIPFVLLGICVIVFFWRFPFMIRAIIFHCDPDKEKDNQRRLFAAKYFMAGFVDILIAVVTIVLIITMIRIPTFYYCAKKEYNDVGRVEDRFRASLAWYKSALYVMVLLIGDIISICQLLIIFIGIIHVPSLFKRAYKVTDIYYKKKKDDATDTTDREYQDALESKRDEEHDEYPLSLSFYRVMISNDLIDTFRHIPHIILLPVKAAGLLFLPFHLFLKWRSSGWTFWREKKDGKHGEVPKSQLRSTQPTMSFLLQPTLWIHEVAKPRMNFWGMDQFFILNLVGLPIILFNELAMLLLAINSLAMALMTLLSPLWRKKVEDFGWVSLGTAPAGIFGFIETILMVLQIVFFPVFVFQQFLMLIVPILFFSALNFSNSGPVTFSTFPGDAPSFAHFWKSFFSSHSYWHESVRYLPWYAWFIQFWWVILMAACIHLTVIHAKKNHPFFDPLMAYLWLVQRVFAGKVWRFYKAILGKGTQFCYVNRKTLGCMGELLMFLLFPIWAYWSIFIPFAARNYYVFIGLPVIWGLLTWQGYNIVKLNWKQPKTKEELTTPKLTVSGFHVELPSTGGVLFTIRGKRPDRFSFSNARLTINGEEFWRVASEVAGSKIITAFKMAMYPVVLHPQFLRTTDIADRTRGNDAFIMKLAFGTEGKYKAAKKTLEKVLNKFIAKGDPEFEIVLECGQTKFEWIKEGIMFRIPNLTIGKLLQSATSGRSVLANEDDIESGLISDDPSPNNDYANDFGSHNKDVRFNTELPDLSVRPTDGIPKSPSVKTMSTNVSEPSSPRNPGSGASTRRVFSDSDFLMDDANNNLLQLVQMGFPEGSAQEALSASGGDLERAINLLTSNM